MAIGIIAEYNPFHNGHIYQLQEAKKRFPGEEIIIIMSGQYVQRGELAIASFKEREKYALQYGASQVIELPFQYATQAAHIFAEGAVKLAHEQKIKKIFFGSESNDPEQLMLIAKTIYAKEDEYSRYLKASLKQGFSFPLSAANALTQLMGKPVVLPNDILGLEYCKAIVKNNFPIEVFSLKRTTDFHSLIPGEKYASASYIRNLIYDHQDISQFSPMKIKDFTRIEDRYFEFQEIVKKLPATELAKIKMVSEGMENLFKKHIDAPTYEEFVNRTNSRRYTSSRIKRVMLYVLLQIFDK